MIFKEGINYSDYKLIRDMLREHKMMLINSSEHWKKKIRDYGYDEYWEENVSMYEMKFAMVDRILKTYFELEDKDMRVNI